MHATKPPRGRTFLLWLAATLAGPCSIASAQQTPQYVDKYIDGGTLAPELFVDDATATDAEGLARAIRIDAVASLLSHTGASNLTENGVIASAQWETLQHGAFTLDATARSGNANSFAGSGQKAGGTATLWQRGLAFDGGWSADTGLGVVNAPVIGLGRQQIRFYLPSWPVAGGATEWRGPSGLQMIAGAGVPGVNSGIQVPAFQTLNGSTATVGGQWSFMPHWTVGAQYAQANDVNLALGSYTGTDARVSSRTAYAAVAWADKADYVQVNLLEGSVQGSGSNFGIWIDATKVLGRYVNNFGAFRLDPGLAWGNQIISSDTQGAYYRLNYQSRQWMFNAGIDEAVSVSGNGVDTTFVTGDVRYQYSRDLGFGGAVNVRRNTGNLSGTIAPGPVDTGSGSPIAWSAQAFVDHVNPYGVGRVQAGYARDQFQDNSALTVDQTWNVPVGATLSTSASVGRIASRATPVYGTIPDGTGISLAAFGSGEVVSNLTLNGNLRWSTILNGNGATSVFANVSLAWRFANNWSVLGTYYENQSSSWTPLIVSSPIAPPVAPVEALRDRGAFLTLRYEFNAGGYFAPLGGRPGSPSGALAGIVFLDANDNGRLDAGEGFAPNVVVLLDGRFSTRTDSQGRFDFPFVSAGVHSITVVSDNMPLQWTLPNEGRIEVEVRTRDTTEVRIPAQRIR
ncbi:MAG: hypothetical protein U1F41_06765 [Burkholderiales bacterium]